MGTRCWRAEFAPRRSRSRWSGLMHLRCGQSSPRMQVDLVWQVCSTDIRSGIGPLARSHALRVHVHRASQGGAHSAVTAVVQPVGRQEAAVRPRIAHRPEPVLIGNADHVPAHCPIMPGCQPARYPVLTRRRGSQPSAGLPACVRAATRAATPPHGTGREQRKGLLHGVGN